MVMMVVALLPSCVTPEGDETGPIALHSPLLENKWNRQNEEIGVRYVDPLTRLNDLLIRRVSRPMTSMAQPPDIKRMYDPDTNPQPIKQSWKTTVIAGKTVRWYQVDEGSGADYPQFRTEPFAVTSSTGDTGYYTVTVSSGMPDNYVQQIDQMFRSIQVK